MNLTPISESKHDELLALLNPLIDFLFENEYSYFIVAGKNGICTRQMRGDYIDVHGMIAGMMENHKQVEQMIKDVVKNTSK